MANELYFETERLTVRPISKHDYDAFVFGYANCEPSKNRFDDGFIDTGFMTPLWFDSLLVRRKSEAEADQSYMLTIFRKEDGLIIGECNITTHLRDEFQYARIGYTILNPYWGMGYATECLSAIIRIAFDSLHFHRIEAHVNLDNPASKRVLLKAGFSFECVRKAFIFEDNVWTDNEIYFLNNENWQQETKSNHNRDSQIPNSRYI